MEIFSSQTRHLCHAKKTAYMPLKETGFEIICSLTEDNIKQLLPTAEKRPESKRKVRFAPPSFHHYTSAPSCNQAPSDNESPWLNSQDFKKIMSSAQLIAKETRKHPIVVGGLEQAVEVASNNAHLLRDPTQFERHLQKLQDEHRGLELWCRFGQSRRGLERYTSQEYNTLRRKHIYKHLKMVTVLWKKGAEPELIRQVSEETSRSSVLFARMLAVADEKAA